MAESKEIQQIRARQELKKRAVVAAWNKGALQYKMHAGQLKIFDSIKNIKARQVLLLISRRWGKSYLAVLLAIMDCLRGPNRQILIIGPNERQTKRIVSYLINLIAEDAPPKTIKMTKSENIWTIGGSTLMIGGFDSAIETVRGMAFHNIYVEETGQAGSDDLPYIIHSVLQPTLQHSRGKIFHLTTPALLPDHSLHTEIYPRCQHDNAFFTYTIRDNPLLTPAQVEEEIENMGGIDSIAVRRELFAEIIRDNALVAVPDFTAKNICSGERPEHSHMWVAGDLGGTKDKTVFLVAYYDFLRGATVIQDELVFDANTSSSVMVAALKAMERHYSIEGTNRFVDAPGQLRIDMAVLHGYSLAQVTKGQGSFDAGLNQLNVAFRNGSLEVHERCKFTILTLNNGTLNKQRSDFARTSILGHCDAIAACIYAYRHRTQGNPYPIKTRDVYETFSVGKIKETARHVLGKIFDDPS